MDDRDRITSDQERPERITVVGRVRQLMTRRGQVAQQMDREPDAAHLASAEFEVDQTAGSVRDGVDLGCSSTAAAANRLLLSPPFPPAPQRWALLVVLSIESVSTMSKPRIRRNI